MLLMINVSANQTHISEWNHFQRCMYKGHMLGRLWTYDGWIVLREGTKQNYYFVPDGYHMWRC
jgi:hypothetical protein